MHKYYPICLTCFALLLFSENTNAQDTVSAAKDSLLVSPDDSTSFKNFKDSIDNLLSPKSYFQASLSYLNNNVYLGRKDSAATPYITPSFGYYHKSGFYISASASYLPSSANSRIDLVSLEGGYAFKAGKFDGQASAAKFWYNSESYNVKSELKGSVSFFGAYDFGFIKPTLTPAVNIGNKLDFAITIGLEHTFYMAKDALDITPTLNVNASTQNYYNSYYKMRKFTVKRNKTTTIVKGSVSGEVLNAAELKMLDYEFTMPLNYTIKKFTFNFTPVYATPINPAVVSVTTKIANQPPKVKTSVEKLSNTFFFQGGITYKF